MAHPPPGSHTPPPPPNGKGDHHLGIDKALQDALDKAAAAWGPGEHWATVQIMLKVKPNPGGVGQYSIVLSQAPDPGA
jgi:hypothetical protein